MRQTGKHVLIVYDKTDNCLLQHREMVAYVLSYRGDSIEQSSQLLCDFTDQKYVRDLNWLTTQLTKVDINTGATTVLLFQQAIAKSMMRIIMTQIDVAINNNIHLCCDVIYANDADLIKYYTC